MSTSEPPLLEIIDLRVRRDQTALLDGVSLAVPVGSIHVVVGPNGAGKSTLIAAILGQTEFTGTIRFHWRSSGRIGFVPQSFTVDPTLPVTVAEFLALARRRRPICFGLAADTRRKVDELLARVGLAGFAARRLGVLSGGELRRVLVANALDPTPELLLLDEPASGLDPAAAAQLDALLLDLRAGGTTALLVSHDVHQVRRVADRVTLLARTVLRSGTADEVLTENPLASYSMARPT